MMHMVEGQKVFQSGGKDGTVVIFADDREAQSPVVERLGLLGAEVRVKRLDVADFLLSDRVAVEKKTVDDFLQSIVDQRLFKQLGDMCDTYEKPILLIEGGNGFFLRRAIHPNAVRGVFSAIAVDFRVPILWTSDAEETAAQLLAIARREQIEEARGISIRAKRRTESFAQQQEFLMAGLPAVSTVLARRLLKKFKRPAAVFAASETELQKVAGIGKEKARRIKEMLEKKYKAEKDVAGRDGRGVQEKL